MLKRTIPTLSILDCYRQRELRSELQLLEKQDFESLITFCALRRGLSFARLRAILSDPIIAEGIRYNFKEYRRSPLSLQSSYLLKKAKHIAYRILGTQRNPCAVIL